MTKKALLELIAPLPNNAEIYVPLWDVRAIQLFAKYEGIKLTDQQAGHVIRIVEQQIHPVKATILLTIYRVAKANQQ